MFQQVEEALDARAEELAEQIAAAESELKAAEEEARLRLQETKAAVRKRVKSLRLDLRKINKAKRSAEEALHGSSQAVAKETQPRGSTHAWSNEDLETDRQSLLLSDSQQALCAPDEYECGEKEGEKE